MKEPESLQEAVEFFADPDNCQQYMIARRWPNGVSCPSCGRTDVRYIATRRLWECKGKHPKRQFTVKVGTIMEDSPISLSKWLMAMWMIANCKNGVSSYEIHRAIKVTQKSAWFMLQRIREALKGYDSGTKLGGDAGGPVEVDETFVGGKLKNMHRDKKTKMGMAGRGGALRNKTVVMGVLDREAKTVRASVIPFAQRDTMEAMVKKHVKFGSTVFTDEHVGYDRLNWHYSHEVVNHMQTYVVGRVHTNGIENFWSLLKRQLHGTYVAVEPFHLHRYVDEQVFRFNNRSTRDKKVTDCDRMRIVASQIFNKRLTFAEVTGKVGETRF